ncbi:hypothetical protein [Microbulbifer thermotolerans]|uniref:hypothetical protein n=1 Tax=Microbulbifer thermotolerans TaxID=252514 RepID=UPI0022491F21|nr:hypothetical protein [Microbulbifer thermotolerans]MCX2833170.1 hypothetical protein [Microbulbifer thermotolerans]
MEELLTIATLLGGITALWFFWDKIAAWATGGKSISPHDAALYEEYKSLFVRNGVADFYSQHDFLGAFREDNWRPLSRYVDGWHTVEHEFVHKKLNKLHKKVYESASRLASAIARNTVPIGPGGHMRSVKPDNMPVGPTPEHIKEEAREINSLVPDFIKARESFVRYANSKLGNGNF